MDQPFNLEWSPLNVREKKSQLFTLWASKGKTALLVNGTREGNNYTWQLMLLSLIKALCKDFKTKSLDILFIVKHIIIFHLKCLNRISVS